MPEINKPAATVYYVARAADGSVLHSGETHSDQVTTTGQPVLEQEDDVEGQLGILSAWSANFPPLPELGTWMDAGERYSYDGGVVEVVQSHWRTADAPETVPALFKVPRGSAPAPLPWVQPTGAHDAYAMGARVVHNGQTWENTGSDANVWEPGVFGWEVVA